MVHLRDVLRKAKQRFGPPSEALTAARRVLIVLGSAALLAGMVGLVLSCCWLRRAPLPAPTVPRSELRITGPLYARVSVADNIGKLKLRSLAAGVWQVPFTGRTLSSSEGAEQWVLSAEGGTVTLGEEQPSGPALLFSAEDGLFELEGLTYRGALLVESDEKGNLRAVNLLPLRDYLRSVVASEMPPRWPLDALMAQAVAARTFAVNRLLGPEPRAKFLRKTELSYKGKQSESSLSDRAVDLTAGIVMTYNEKLFPAFFHSACGGHTTSVRKVFGEPDIAPLQGVPCQWCKDSPFYRWKITLEKSDLAAALQAWGLGEPETLRAIGTEPDGYAAFVLANDSVRIPAYQFRLAIGAHTLRSAAFGFEKVNGTFVVSGRGWGHGVGLCQWGARGMASAGRSWDAILQHYYPSASLRKLY